MIIMIFANRKILFCLCVFFLFGICLNAQTNDIDRSYDEFTGETLITAEVADHIEFTKVISESGETSVSLKWHSSSPEKPSSNNLRLIILFTDNSRLSINLPIKCSVDEFWSSVMFNTALETNTLVDPTVYQLESEVNLNASQIEILKNKSIKKYRLDGYGENEIGDRYADSKAVFGEMLNQQ